MNYNNYYPYNFQNFPKYEIVKVNGKNGAEAAPLLISESEFAKAVVGKDIKEVLSVMDETMEALTTLNPRLYDGILRKLRG